MTRSEQQKAISINGMIKRLAINRESWMAGPKKLLHVPLVMLAIGNSHWIKWAAAGIGKGILGEDLHHESREQNKVTVTHCLLRLVELINKQTH